MKVEVALKLIIVLLAVMITSVVLLIILTNYDGEGSGSVTTTEDTSPESSSDDAPGTTPPEATTPEQSTTPEITTPEQSTTPPVTTPEATTTPEQSTTPDSSDGEITPPESSEGGQKVPEGFVLDKTYRYDSGAKLNLIVELHAEPSEDGYVKVTAKMYVEHYSLYLGKRGGTQFLLGDKGQNFTVDPIEYSGTAKKKTLLYEFEEEFEYGQTLELYASYPCRCTYSGISIENLVISDSVELK